MRAIDADEFSRRMYSVAFVEDTDMQKWDSGCWIRYKLFEQVLREQPTIEPERKTGKWIKLDMHHKCTACGQECYVPTCMGEPMYTYCPNCGARMEGENETD